MSYKQFYFSLLFLLLKGMPGLWRLGIQLWSQNLLMVTLYPFIFVSTLSMSSFFPHLCLFPWHLSVNNHILSQDVFSCPKRSCILSWNLPGRLCRVISSGIGAMCSSSAEAADAADRNPSPAPLETPSRHHIAAQNPLGLPSMSRLLFQLRVPNLWASAYHRNRHSLFPRACTSS